MVDIVGRVVIEEDDSRWIKFKSDNVQFGGGRLKFGTDRVELEYNKFMELYRTAKPDTAARAVPQAAQEEQVTVTTDEHTEVPAEESSDSSEDKPKRRSRRSA